MPPRVLVTVSGGMTEIYIEGEVEVLTVDYDIEGFAEDELIYDQRGKSCLIRRELTADSTLVGEAFEHFGSVD